MTPQEIRRRVVSYACFGALAGTAWWGLARGFPEYRRLEGERASLERVQAMTLQARESSVRSGSRALEDSISAARARVAEMREMVPDVGTGEADGEVRRLIVALAERSGVVVRAVEEGAGGREGTLFVSSARLAATGRYHDVGAWLSMVTATRRLVQVGDVRMGVESQGSSPAVEAAHRLQGAETGPVSIDVTFRWFRQDPARAARDSTKGSR